RVPLQPGEDQRVEAGSGPEHFLGAPQAAVEDRLRFGTSVGVSEHVRQPRIALDELPLGTGMGVVTGGDTFELGERVAIRLFGLARPALGRAGVADAAMGI